MKSNTIFQADQIVQRAGKKSGLNGMPSSKIGQQLSAAMLGNKVISSMGSHDCDRDSPLTQVFGPGKICVRGL